MQHKVTFIKKEGTNFYFDHHGEVVMIDEGKVTKPLTPGDSCLMEIAFGRIKEIY